MSFKITRLFEKCCRCRCSADADAASASTSSTFASDSESDEEGGNLTLSTKNLPRLRPVLRFDKPHKKSMNSQVYGSSHIEKSSCWPTGKRPWPNASSM